MFLDAVVSLLKKKESENDETADTELTHTQNGETTSTTFAADTAAADQGDLPATPENKDDATTPGGGLKRENARRRIVTGGNFTQVMMERMTEEAKARRPILEARNKFLLDAARSVKFEVPDRFLDAATGMLLIDPVLDLKTRVVRERSLDPPEPNPTNLKPDPALQEEIKTFIRVLQEKFPTIRTAAEAHISMLKRNIEKKMKERTYAPIFKRPSEVQIDPETLAKLKEAEEARRRTRKMLILQEQKRLRDERRRQEQMNREASLAEIEFSERLAKTQYRENVIRRVYVREERRGLESWYRLYSKSAKALGLAYTYPGDKDDAYGRMLALGAIGGKPSQELEQRNQLRRGAEELLCQHAVERRAIMGEEGIHFKAVVNQMTAFISELKKRGASGLDFSQLAAIVEGGTAILVEKEDHIKRQEDEDEKERRHRAQELELIEREDEQHVLEQMAASMSYDRHQSMVRKTKLSEQEELERKKAKRKAKKALHASFMSEEDAEIQKEIAAERKLRKRRKKKLRRMIAIAEGLPVSSSDSEDAASDGEELDLMADDIDMDDLMDTSSSSDSEESNDLLSDESDSVEDNVPAEPIRSRFARSRASISGSPGILRSGVGRTGMYRNGFGGGGNGDNNNNNNNRQQRVVGGGMRAFGPGAGGKRVTYNDDALGAWSNTNYDDVIDAKLATSSSQLTPSSSRGMVGGAFGYGGGGAGNSPFGGESSWGTDATGKRKFVYAPLNTVHRPYDPEAMHEADLQKHAERMAAMRKDNPAPVPIVHRGSRVLGMSGLDATNLPTSSSNVTTSRASPTAPAIQFADDRIHLADYYDAVMTETLLAAHPDSPRGRRRHFSWKPPPLDDCEDGDGSGSDTMGTLLPYISPRHMRGYDGGDEDDEGLDVIRGSILTTICLQHRRSKLVVAGGGGHRSVAASLTPHAIRQDPSTSGRGTGVSEMRSVFPPIDDRAPYRGDSPTRYSPTSSPSPHPPPKSKSKNAAASNRASNGQKKTLMDTAASSLGLRSSDPLVPNYLQKLASM
eukprot:PhM_4_TR2928/c0_g1_i1/m.51199